VSEDTPKRVLITGANKGIGFATVAAILSEEDDTFVFLGSRDKGRGEAARRALVEREPSWRERLAVLRIDVADDESVTSAAGQVADRYGHEPAPLYGIVNNAGVGLGTEDMGRVFEVNTYGPHRVCEAFIPLLQPSGGRIVNVSSASGPNFVSRCSAERQRFLTDPEITWVQIDAFLKLCLTVDAEGIDFADVGLGDGSAYGISKACLNAYTMALARTYPSLVVNACTPGFIETDLTRPYAEASDKSPRELGMKPPEAGTRSPLFLLLGDPPASGWYFGSDAQRSPLHRYRSPGDPPYTGE
jgi:NAD(P)-dependent dehydrogenase (short-subunit alcohol dehydrogenase family)